MISLNKYIKFYKNKNKNMLIKIKGLLNRTNKGTYLALLFMIVFIFSGDVAFAGGD